MSRAARAALAAILGIGFALLVNCGSSLPSRAQVERDEDRFCAAVASARVAERAYGLDPSAAGASP